MADKLWFLIPEIWLFVGVVVVSVMGLSRRKMFRDLLPLVVCVFLVGAFIITPLLYSEQRVSAAGLLMPMLGKYVNKVLEDAFLHYNVANDPDVRPDFTPISPAERKKKIGSSRK